MLEQDTAGKEQEDMGKEQLAAQGRGELGSRCSLELGALGDCHDQSPCGSGVPSSATLPLPGRYIHRAHRVRPTDTGRGLAAVVDERPTAEQEVNAATEVLGRADCTGAEQAEHMAADHTAAAVPDHVVAVAVVAVVAVVDTAAERSSDGSSEVLSEREVEVELHAADHAPGATAAAEDMLVGEADEHHMLVRAAVRKAAAVGRKGKQGRHRGILRDLPRASVRLDLGQRHGHHAVVVVDRVVRTAAGNLQATPRAELERVPGVAARNCRPWSQY